MQGKYFLARSAKLRPKPRRASPSHPPVCRRPLEGPTLGATPPEKPAIGEHQGAQPQGPGRGSLTVAQTAVRTTFDEV